MKRNRNSPELARPNKEWKYQTPNILHVLCVQKVNMTLQCAHILRRPTNHTPNYAGQLKHSHLNTWNMTFQTHGLYMYIQCMVFDSLFLSLLHSWYCITIDVNIMLLLGSGRDRSRNGNTVAGRRRWACHPREQEQGLSSKATSDYPATPAAGGHCQPIDCSWVCPCHDAGTFTIKFCVFVLKSWLCREWSMVFYYS